MNSQLSQLLLATIIDKQVKISHFFFCQCCYGESLSMKKEIRLESRCSSYCFGSW